MNFPIDVEPDLSSEDEKTESLMALALDPRLRGEDKL